MFDMCVYVVNFIEYLKAVNTRQSIYSKELFW